MLKTEWYELGYKLLVLYIYTLLFASFVLNKIDFPIDIGLKLLSFLDIIPLCIWILYNPRLRIKTKDFFVDTFQFWVIWFLLLGLLLFTSYWRGASIIPSFVYWGALIRFIPLAYIVVSLNKHIDINDRLLKHLKRITVILLIVGYLCLILGERATILLPLLPKNATGERETLEGNYSAIFANTIDYGFILVLLYIIWTYKKNVNSPQALMLIIVFFIPVFKTGSAAATLVFVIVAFFRLTQTYKLIRKFIIYSLLLITITLFYIYWDMVILVYENAQLSRIGMLTMTAPDFIKEMSIDTLFGVGLDPVIVYDKVNSYSDKVFMLQYVEPEETTSAFGDVYWVAILVYQGVIGLVLMVWMYLKLLKSTISKNYRDNEYDYKRIVKWVFFAIAFWALLNQVLVVKTFALIFWLFLGVVYSKINKINNENITNK